MRKTAYKGAQKEAEQKVVNLYALNERQEDYIRALDKHEQVVVCGYSGTGKTFIAATAAANLYLRNKINKIIITRPNVAVGPGLGHLPGDLNEKFAPWALPVLEVLRKQLGEAAFEIALKRGNIEMAPLSMMRGRSFEDAFIILDEAQNTTIPEIKMFLTRIGENCKVVVNGDIRQSDISAQSGLSKILHLIKKNGMKVPVIEFGVDDIVRSNVCKDWIIAFETENL